MGSPASRSESATPGRVIYDLQPGGPLCVLKNARMSGREAACIRATQAVATTVRKRPEIGREVKRDGG